MATFELSALNLEQLTELLGNAQPEMAARARQRRKDPRSELERRVAAEGYSEADIFREFRTGAANGSSRRKMPVKFRDPESPGDIWTGIGRSPKWVQAILTERIGRFVPYSPSGKHIFRRYGQAAFTGTTGHRSTAPMVASIGVIASPAQGAGYFERDGY